MKKIIIFPLSLYVNTNMQRSVEAFAKLGVSKWKMIWHWTKLQGIFNAYRCGKYNNHQFRKKIRDIFPELRTENADPKFDAAWNAMCQVTPFTKKAFDEMAQLAQTKDTEVFLLSGTNLLHWDHICREYGKAPPGRPFLSFEKGKLEKSLMNALLSELPPQSQSVLFYYTPTDRRPFPQCGLLNFFIAPFRTWDYYKAKRYVTSLQKQTEDKITLIRSQHTASEPRITEQVRNWEKRIEQNFLESKTDHILEIKSYIPGQNNLRNRDLLNTKQIDNNSRSKSKLKSWHKRVVRHFSW